MRKLLVFIFVCLVFNGFSQDYLKKADARFRSDKMDEAKELYYQAYLENPDNYIILKRLAQSNEQLGLTEEAEKWMRKIVEQGNYAAGDLFLFTELLISNDKFEEAEDWFHEYSVLKPAGNEHQEKRDYFGWIKNLKSNSYWLIEPVSLNTAGSELGICNWNNGIIFSASGRDEKASGDDLNNMDLYYAEKVDNTNFNKITEFAQNLNTSYSDGPITINARNNILYITRHAPDKVLYEERGLYYHMQVVKAKQENNGWKLDDEFFFNSHKYSVAHPCINHSGELLFFASDVTGGYGGFDIYVCYLKNDKWSEPYNLGEYVNSSGNEMFPYINADNMLYFSSDGHRVIGGYDVFSAIPENGVFRNIQHLGIGINSAKDDVAVYFDPSGSRGYVSSDRAGGKGLFDIYYFENKVLPIMVTGEVKDFESGQRLTGVEIEFQDTDGNILQSVITNAAGEFNAEVQKTTDMVFKAGGDKFEALTRNLDLKDIKGGDELILEVSLYKK